jgi:hypothetical protein
MSMTAVIDDLKTLRVDQVGSLSAPAALQQVFDAYKRGQASKSSSIALRMPPFVM